MMVIVNVSRFQNKIIINCLNKISMQSSRAKRSPKNQFLQTPHTQRHRIKEKQKLSEDIKAKYIQELEERNRKLKYQIMKINEMFDEQKQKVPKKREYKLIPNETTSDVIKKQLENVYKQIKNYERQINNIEAKQAGGLITDKMARLEGILKEKSSHLDKLKIQLSVLTKKSVDNSKKLKDNVEKEGLQNLMLKYNDDIKIIREKMRTAEEKEKKKMENAKKQFDYIKKLERELIENGISMDQLDDMKKNNVYTHIYDKLNNGGGAENSNANHEKHKERIASEEVEQMTLERYNELKNEIKLYKKLHLDYDKRLNTLDKEKKIEDSNTLKSKEKLKEKQSEISKLQEQIGELKMKMRKVNLKANFTNVLNPLDSKEKSKQKQKVTKIKNPNAKSITDQTHLKYDEKGLPTQKGQRFTDRTAIGKNVNSKITTVRVWTEKSSFAICGIQCIYLIGNETKNGIENINRDTKKLCSQNLMELVDGDFIKTVSGHLSQNNIIQYLVFISNNSVIGRFGVAKPTQKQFNFDIDDDEIPICLYGSIVVVKDNKKQLSLIEQIGFEISRDKAFGKGDKFI